MLTLDRVVRRGSVTANRIEVPFKGLQRVDFALVKGQLGMVVAAPGVGKSAWALQLALRAGLPTLYCSADTDAWTITLRTLAHITGHPQSYLRTCLEGGYEQERIAEALARAAHVQFTFDSYTIADVEQDLAAYGVIHGSLPELIVVDNMMNLARGGENEFSAQRKAMDDLHGLAQATGAHVLVLHHAQGQYDDGNKPIPLSGIANKLSALPAQVLSLHRSGPDGVVMCPVKNRQGQADPSASTLHCPARFDGERQTFHTE